jgi:hypothetical protein
VALLAAVPLHSIPVVWNLSMTQQHYMYTNNLSDTVKHYIY